MAWPYAPKHFAEALAANKANNYTPNNNNPNNNSNNITDNILSNQNSQGAAAAEQQFQSLLGDNDVLQRQFAAAHQHADPSRQQQLLAAQLALHQQQQQLLSSTGMSWGAPSAPGRPGSTTPGDVLSTASANRSPALVPKAGATSLGTDAGAASGANHHQQMMASMGAVSNPYLGFSLHHLQGHHHLGGGVGFPGGTAQFLNPAGNSVPQFHQGIPPMMHQLHQFQQMQQIQQQIQQMQQLQQHMQQQAQAFSIGGAPSGTTGAGQVDEDGAGNAALGPQDLLSMMNTMPGATAGLGNPLQGVGPSNIGNLPSSMTNSIGNSFSSVNGLQQLMRKTAMNAEEHAAMVAAEVASSGKVPKSASSNGSNNPSGSNTQKQRSIMNSNPNFFAVEPTCNDILSGRGNFVNNHDGNRNFRNLVASQRVMYVAAPKEFKPQFARKIIEALRSLGPPGRFLQQDNDTKLWYELDEKKAMAKTRQALREGAPEVFKQITSDDSQNEGGHNQDMGGGSKGYTNSVKSEISRKVPPDDSAGEQHYSPSAAASNSPSKSKRPRSPDGVVKEEKKDKKKQAMKAAAAAATADSTELESEQKSKKKIKMTASNEKETEHVPV